MEFEYKDGKLVIKKELLNLDQFVLSFVKLLEAANIKYVIVSGYVGIFFGRSRNTEDIDILIERCGKETFTNFWNLTINKFGCMNATNVDSAYKNYLSENSALRFHEKDKFIPNAELKFIKNEIDKFTLDHRLEILFNSNRLFFSPFEIQVAYKLYMGSEKDIEDARFVYKLFYDKINKRLLNELLVMLKVPKNMLFYLE
ncbi:hypothetical protein J4450_02405 [Candidatus Micrarchaeota archaeon]|nr:hypothetical protein [Candidatus Micrarchaeota archaeon]